MQVLILSDLGLRPTEEERFLRFGTERTAVPAVGVTHGEDGQWKQKKAADKLPHRGNPALLPAWYNSTRSMRNQVDSAPAFV